MTCFFFQFGLFFFHIRRREFPSGNVHSHSCGFCCVFIVTRDLLRGIKIIVRSTPVIIQLRNEVEYRRIAFSCPPAGVHRSSV